MLIYACEMQAIAKAIPTPITPYNTSKVILVVKPDQYFCAFS